MKTLRLIFSKNGASFDVVPLEGEFECAVQNALVNIGSVKGSDSVFEDKGTNLLKSALNGALVDLNSANHVTVAAALDTLLFSQATDYPDTTERLSTLALKPASFSGGVITIDAQFKSSLGRVSGSITNLV